MPLLLMIPFSAEAQRRDTLHTSAISIEHSYIPGIFIYGAFIPDNFEYAHRITRKLYLQGGVFAQSADEIPGETFFTTGFGLYAGATMKFHLFKEAYFTPALNIYFDYDAENIFYRETFTIGPTVAFEYFLSNRFSLRLDLLNVNFGIGLPEGDVVGTVHRLIGIGGRYNFSFK